MPDPRPMSEDELLSNVLDLCKLLHLRTAHFRPAKTARGWRTAVQGDGSGFPDLVIAGPGGLLIRELKSATGRSTAEQTAWHVALRAAGVDVCVWFPDDWRLGTIQGELGRVRTPGPAMRHDQQIREDLR